MIETSPPELLGPFVHKGSTYFLELETASKHGVCNACKKVFSGGSPIYFLKGDGPLVHNPNGFERIHTACGLAYYDEREQEDPARVAGDTLSVDISQCWVDSSEEQGARHVVRDENGELWRTRDRRKADGFAEGMNSLVKRGDVRLARLLTS